MYLYVQPGVPGSTYPSHKRRQYRLRPAFFPPAVAVLVLDADGVVFDDIAFFVVKKHSDRLVKCSTLAYDGGRFPPREIPRSEINRGSSTVALLLLYTKLNSRQPRGGTGGGGE